MNKYKIVWLQHHRYSDRYEYRISRMTFDEGEKVGVMQDQCSTVQEQEEVDDNDCYLDEEFNVILFGRIRGVCIKEGERLYDLLNYGDDLSEECVELLNKKFKI